MISARDSAASSWTTQCGNLGDLHMRWYVYKLIDPRTGLPFYIGKGSGNRVHQHEREAARRVCSEKTNKIRDIQNAGFSVLKNVASWHAVERNAYCEEARLIAEIGLANLTNVAPGGGGAARTWRSKVLADAPAAIPPMEQLMPNVAWIYVASSGFTEEPSALDTPLATALSSYVEKHLGGVCGYAKRLLKQWIARYGIDHVFDELHHVLCGAGYGRAHT